MKEIIVKCAYYEARDGSFHATKDACVAYEDALDQIESVIKLPAITPLDEGQYYQHDPVFDAQTVYYDLRKIGPFPMDAPEPWESVYCRLERIDGLAREWSQPYYAMHPPVNPVRVDDRGVPVPYV